MDRHRVEIYYALEFPGIIIIENIILKHISKITLIFRTLLVMVVMEQDISMI